VTRRELAREIHVDLRRRPDLDPNDPIPARGVEQAGDLEARDPEFLGDLALARAVEEVAAGSEHGGDHVEACGMSFERTNGFIGSSFAPTWQPREVRGATFTSGARAS